MNLLDKCKKDGLDPLLGLLNLRKFLRPRDQVLGSPVQRLMSRCTRYLLPVAKKLLAPRALNNKHVFSRLKSKRMQQKASNDRGAKPLPPLYPQQVLRLHTSRGYKKVVIVRQPTTDPRSYIVNVGERERERERERVPQKPQTSSGCSRTCSCSSSSNQSECSHFSCSSQPERFSFLLC